MNHRLLLPATLLLLLAPALLAAVPTAEARPVCTFRDRDCGGNYACMWYPVSQCVPDLCDSTICPAAAPELPPLVDICTDVTSSWCGGLACVTVSRQVPFCVGEGIAVNECATVFPANDGEVGYCVDPDGACKASVYRGTKMGTETTCLVPLAMSAGAADACYTIIPAYDGELTVCHDLDGPCKATVHRSTYLGSESYCVGVHAPAALPKCVEYAFVHDYQWYYVCVDLGGPIGCKVYHKRVVGVTDEITCIA
jgi:hypothetical protein